MASTSSPLVDTIFDGRPGDLEMGFPDAHGPCGPLRNLLDLPFYRQAVTQASRKRATASTRSSACFRKLSAAALVCSTSAAFCWVPSSIRTIEALI